MRRKYDGTLEEQEALELFIRLSRASNAVFARAAQQIRTLGLTAGQFGVLETLYHTGPLLQKELAGKLLRSEGNITQILDKLEAKKLVKKVRRSDDRRKIEVHITVRGAQLIKKIFPEFAAKVIEIMSPLTAAEKETIGELLVKLGTANVKAMKLNQLVDTGNRRSL